MVVNRKQPSIPAAPAVSRSSSTQPIPTKKVTKNTIKPIQPQNGGHEIDSRKNKSKPTKLQTKKRKSRPLLDRIFFFALSLFAFYTFYTCRPNPLFPSSPSEALIHDPNALCRSLATYRTHIIDPYVLPPLRYSISHTQAIAEPYITQTRQRIDPYVAPVLRAVDVVKPYAIHTVSAGKHVWNGILVPIYQKTLKPYWIKAVVPRYKKYVHPRLVPLAKHTERYYRYYVANPLRIQSLKTQRYLHAVYRTHINPYVVKVQPRVELILERVQTTSARAYSVYNTHVHPRIISGWKLARPFLCKGLRVVKQVSIQALDIGGKQLKRATKEAGSLRRTYVDPHVRKIWEKVAEGTELATTTPTSPITDTAEVKQEVLSTAQETQESSEEPTPTPSQTLAETFAATTTEFVEAHDTPVADVVPEEIAEDEPEAPGIHAGIRTAPPPPVDVDEPIVEAVKSDESTITQAPSTTDAPEPVPEEESVEPTIVSEPLTPSPSSTPSATAANDEIDLDEFLNDLGVSETTSADEPVPDGPEITIQEVTEPVASSEDKLAETAAKRLDIVTRHEGWFVKLDDAITEATASLAKALEDWRNSKVPELEKFKTKGALNSIQKDGEKLLRGLESFLKHAESRSSSWKVSKDQQKLEDITLEDKIEAYKSEVSSKKAVANQEKEKWEKVLSKVEEKFSDRVRQLHVEIHTWYMTMREREGELVVEYSDSIKNLAERAQADLGLDYAWLDDVTVQDWQRYHDLMRKHEAFEQTAYAMQNMTAPNAPQDPIMPLLDSLDEDMQDIVSGFQVALAAVRGDAAKVYSIHQGAGVEDDDTGFFVVNDGQVRRDDLRGVDFGDLGLQKKAEGAGVVGLRPASDSSIGSESNDHEGEVHILPIDPVAAGDSAFDPSMVIIGKDKVQIEQALKDIPVESSKSKKDQDESVLDAGKLVIGKDKVQVEQALKDVPVENVHVHEEL